jgi:RHS repeat-associated protein
MGGELLAEYDITYRNVAHHTVRQVNLSKEYGYRNGQLLITAAAPASVLCGMYDTCGAPPPEEIGPIGELESGAGGPIQWLVTDQLGTPRMIFNQSGSLAGVSRHDYLPFGEELFAGTGGRTVSQGYSAADNVRQKFTSKERDIETGLDYFGARYYSSVQGRFTGVDIAGPNLSNPQSLNKYAYTLNNPLRYIDRNGLYEEDVHYHLTQALAEAAGFTQSQAAMIATSDQMTDETPGMEPFSGVEARRNYHFTTEQRRQDLLGDFVSSAISSGAAMETTLDRLGVFLHAEQDSYSHEGYGPVLGHGMAGHAPDKTYNDPAKADRMAFDTFSRLTGAATVLYNNQKISFQYKPLDGKVLNPLVQSFNRAKSPEEKQKIVNQITTLARQNIQRQAEEAIRKKQEEERKRERR